MRPGAASSPTAYAMRSDVYPITRCLLVIVTAYPKSV